MNVVSLITQLAQQDIRLWLEEGNLRYSAPDGAMTPDIISQLRAAKADIVAFLQQSEHGKVQALPHADRSQPLALSFAQQRLWFIHQLDPANTAYHIHIALNIKGALDVALLAKACSEIIRRHEILRTRYVQENGKVHQMIEPATAISLNAESVTPTALPAAIRAELHQPFNLAENILRIRLWQLADNEHALAFTVHHIAADGWSLGIFVNELVHLYQAFQTGSASQLPETTFQYADYALWQNRNAELHASQLDYWKNKLQGTPNLALPYDQAPNANSDTTAAYVERRLNAGMMQSLHELNKTQGTTPFMFLLASLSALLHRYTHQDDFALGTPIAGRSLAAVEPLIGCFINVLAIRCEPYSAQPFSEYLQTIKTTCAEAFSNQDVPFEQIVHHVVQERDLTINPLFQVMLAVQNAPGGNLPALQNLTVTPYQESEVSAQFDLKLAAMEEQGEMVLRLEYKQSLFAISTVEHLADRLLHLINDVLANPTISLQDINLFGDVDIAARLGLQQGGENDTFAALPDDLLVHHLFEQQVEKTPDALAVMDHQRRLTYAELNKASNRLAHLLLAQGAKGLIGICLLRGVDMTIALLATLKAGCGYVPFDPEFPAERMGFMAEQTRITHILCNADTANVVSAFSTLGLNMGNLDKAALDQQPDTNPNVPLKNEDLFNVIYTSGSTGQPKGVAVAHKGISNRLLWGQKNYPLSAGDTLLQKTPYSFDVSVWELFWPIITGSKYFYSAPEGHKDPAYLSSVIQQENITIVHFVPSMLSSFLNHPNSRACTGIRRTFCSGEALQLEQVRQFYEAFPQAEIVNLYGPTEASIEVSYYNGEKQPRHASVPIGKPIDNVQLHVLDHLLQPVPCGIAGELHIAGIGLARGYLERDDLTAKAFIPNPFVKYGHPSPRLYKTGDLVKLSPDGNILYLGRIDHQIKMRGYRIELGEIENALLTYPGIQSAVVVAQKLSATDSRLVAYYHAADSIPHDALARHLGNSLPVYVLPSAYIHMIEWPLTTSGKLSRNKLPTPDWNNLNRREYVAPATPTEIALAAIWSEVLQVEKIGLHDSFFELGGHSLTATQVLARAQDTFKVEVPLRQIFDNPTVAGIAELIDKALLEQAVFSTNITADDESESFIL